MKFSHRSSELDTYIVRHCVFEDTYKNDVHEKMVKFLNAVGKRRCYISSTYWTEVNSDPWRHWETLHFISLTYKRPVAYYPG